MAIGYGTITEEVLSVIKAPPQKSNVSSSQYDNVAAADYNLIKTEFFQFKTRFIYDDNEKSVFSAPSRIWGPLPRSVSGNVLPYGEAFNSIRLRFDIPDNPTIISIDVAVKRGNRGIWYLAETINVSAYRGSTYDYYFLNDKTFIPLDQKDANRPYDYVPRKAGVQELIDDNRIVYGDITTGYDNDITIDIDLATAYESYDTKLWSLEVTKGSTSHYSLDFSQLTGVTPWTFVYYSMDIVIIGDGVANRYVLPSRYHKMGPGGGVAGAIGTTNISQYFATLMADDPVIETVNVNPGDSNILEIYFKKYIEAPEVLNTLYGLLYNPGGATPEDIRTMKDGAVQYFGIVYGDKYGRLAPVLADENTELNVPFITEATGPAVRELVKLDYTLNHTPPEWAHTWRLVYGGSSIAWFQQFVIRAHNESDKSVWRENGRVKIKINEGINDVRDVLNDYKVTNYIWEEGDKLRIIGTRSVTGSSYVNDPTITLSNYEEYEVVDFDGVYAYIDDWTIYGSIDLESSTDDIIIEIYKLRKESDENLVYYGIGEVYDITDPGTPARAHASYTGEVYVGECYAYESPMVSLLESSVPTGAIPTTTTTTTTSSTFTTDIPDILTEPYGIRCFPIFSLYRCPFTTGSNLKDIGEPHIINEDYKEQRLNALTYGGKFIARTQINELNRFTYDAFDPMDDKHGVLYGIRQVGYTLKVIQTSKNTSIYLNREYYVDPQGNEQLILTDNVLGSKRPHEEEYGTVFSRSIAHVDRDLFYYDIYSGKIIRDMPNGQQAISLGGIDSHLRTKSRTLLDSGLSNIDVLSGIDEKNGVVYFTFLDSNTPANDETIGYHIYEKRWVGNVSFIPELYSTMGDNMFISFKSGEFYKHNSDSVNRNYFYGVQYGSEIHVVSNINPQVLKTWDSIEVGSNKLWTVAEDDSIVIDSSTRYGGGMQSKILSGDWEEYEEVFRAPFNFDMLSGDNSTADAYYLHNGRELRGRNMLIKLKNADTSEVNLVMVTVNSKLSL